MRGYYYSPQNSLGNAPVAIKHNDNGITQTSYYQNDHLNTPQMLTRPNGAVVWQGQYDAFGEVTQTNTQVSNPLRFPGQYQDDETGLHYNWYRYYDAQTGRYVTSDPIGLRGGLNTYGYVGGNPLIHMDPYGLFCLNNDEINGLAGGIGGAIGGFVGGAISGGNVAAGLIGAARGGAAGFGAGVSSNALGAAGSGAIGGVTGGITGMAAGAVGGVAADLSGGGAVGGAVGGLVGGFGSFGGVVGGVSGAIATDIIGALNDCEEECGGD